MPRIDRTAFFIWLALCLVGGGLLSWFTVVPFWGGSLIVTAALIINGVIAEVEDNSPDGFNNPNNNQNDL